MSHIYIIVSVDWEGRSLLDENLQAMQSFRERHPDVPMQQFLNAAYYTKDGADLQATTQKIQSTLLPDDEHGLHIHAWHSLIDRAGVTPRDGPCAVNASEKFEAQRNLKDWNYYPQDGGFDVPIDRFDVIELSKVLRTSIEILTAQGFRRARSFRAGGWMGGKNVLDALTENGFSVDASAGNVKYVIERFGDIPLCQWMTELWPHIDDCSQPYKVNTVNGDIWEIPNNGCLVDYTTTEQILEIFAKNLELWKQTPEKDVFVSTGFHQETADRCLARLDASIVLIKEQAEREGLPVIFIANPVCRGSLV